MTFKDMEALLEKIVQAVASVGNIIDLHSQKIERLEKELDAIRRMYEMPGETK